ncbi:MAG: thioredoxin family protein, partial [Planctomycetes bacterium]|nr:thioredoxin family protein [Planctomycetota bacterium]
RHFSAGWGLALCLVVAGTGDAVAGEFSADPLSFGTGSGFSLARAQKPLMTARAAAEYATFVPGEPFRVLVTLSHAPDHYSYWRNPGGPGVGTGIRWDLPAGFSLSGPEWPAPRRYDTGGIISYICDGDVTLVYTVAPPADAQPGEVYTLNGEITTQVCTSRSCNPLTLPITLEITAGTAAGAPDAAVVRAVTALPEPPRRWRFEAFLHDTEIAIAMYPGPGSRAEPDGVYFFDAAEAGAVADSQRPQILEKDGGIWWLRVPRKQPGTSGSGDAGDGVRGVLYADNGWLEAEPDRKAFALDLPFLAAGSGKPPGLQRAVNRNTAMLLLFAFLGGLLLNVMPCVFPVIGLKIMGFAKQAHKDRRSIFLHGLAYAGGVLLCFWTLAFLVITMGRGWGAQLQSDWFLFALCHLFLIMSMNMAGVFDVGASMAGANQAIGGREGMKRSFFTGLLATITSTPCSAPFLGTALAYALSLPPLLSLGVFTLMGLGFAFPYLALSLVPSWLKKLPKPGPWMDTFRQAMCFPLFATTAYLFWTMEAMLGEWHFLMLLFGLVLTAMACWLYGKFQKSRARHAAAGRILAPAAVLALAAGLWLGMPSAAGELEWQDWSPETVSRLREEGRPVYVDFTARWCATCQVNKRVYRDRQLAALLRRKNVALLKADWTQYDDRITSTLRDEFDKAAVPVTVVYTPGQRHASVLPDILTVENVSAVIGDLPDWVAARTDTAGEQARR